MKLKFEFIINEIADQKVAVAVGDGLEQFNGFLKMDDVGESIFKKLNEDISEDELVAAMQKEYPDETPESVRECVIGFTSKLKDAGLLA